MAKVKAKKKVSMDSAKKGEGRGRKGETGKVSGLNIRNAWAKLLEANEKAPKAKKQTDEQIQKAMRQDFPGRDSSFFTNPSAVNVIRKDYNSGKLTGSKPGTVSQKYDNSGNVLTPRGKVVGGEGKAKAAAKKK